MFSLLQAANNKKTSKIKINRLYWWQSFIQFHLTSVIQVHLFLSITQSGRERDTDSCRQQLMAWHFTLDTLPHSYCYYMNVASFSSPHDYFTNVLLVVLYDDAIDKISVGANTLGLCDISTLFILIMVYF